MRRIRRHLTFANAASGIALFVALSGGTAVALSGTNTVFTDDIANDTQPASGGNPAGGLVAADLRPNSVGGSEVINDSLTGADTALGYSRPQASTPTSGVDQTSPKEVTVDCPAGSKVTGGGYIIDGGSGIVALRSYAVDANTWLVRAVDEDGPSFWGLTVVANCLNG